MTVHALPAWRHAWLEALGEEGADVHAAAARAASGQRAGDGAVIADLTLWPPVAVAQGFVALSQGEREAQRGAWEGEGLQSSAGVPAGRS